MIVDKDSIGIALFICGIKEKTYRLLNAKKFTLFLLKFILFNKPNIYTARNLFHIIHFDKNSVH